MRIGNYEVQIPEGREIVNQDQSVYVAVKANAHFSILLINHDNRRAVAEVKIESDSMGNPILNPFGRLPLEGKVNSQMRFTVYASGVYASGSAEAIAVGEEVLTPAEKGLINVTFYAAKESEPLFEATRVEINLRLVIENENRPTPISARRAIGNPVAPPVA